MADAYPGDGLFGAPPRVRVHAPPLPTHSNELLQAILDGTTDSIFLKDCAGRYVTINAAGARYVGRAVAEIIGRRDDELFPPETARRIMEHDLTVLRTGVSSSFEAELPVGGRRRVFLSTKTPYRNEHGAIVGLIGISRDITERKEALEALRESNQRLEAIVQSSPAPIIALGRDGCVQMWNPAAERVFGWTAAEVMHGPLPIVPEDQRGQFQELFARALRGEGVAGVQVNRERKDGSRLDVAIWTSALHAASGEIAGVMCMLVDVTELTRAEEELKKLRMESLYWREEVRTALGPDEMVGQSAAIQRVRRAIEQVAATDSTVLVTGETGTGKELVARAIHARSGRRGRVLVKVNCAALPAGLVESELFGHEKGAFTGALTRKIGRFEVANGGTIFLDEIGDLPLELQVKLLRVLQEGEFERVGGMETIRVDVRVVAATNRDLETAMRAGRFRDDLFYRLNVFPIRVPALRERPDDVPLLARHFALLHATRMGRQIESLSPAVLDALRRYDWPGNVRELQNVIERAVILSSGEVLELNEWPPAAPRGASSLPPAAGVLTLAESERQQILNALEQTNWRVSGDRGAARLLGLKPTTLESRMKRLGIRRK